MKSEIRNPKTERNPESDGRTADTPSDFDLRASFGSRVSDFGLAPILNRDFQHPADGWYMIEPRGEHPNAAAGIVQVIDEQAVQNIVSDFNAAAAAPNFPGMLVDHEHFSHDQDKETRAFGWLNKLQARPDGIYGQIRWTDTGRAAVDGGDYRFFSTEYAGNDLQPLKSEIRNPMAERNPKSDGRTPAANSDVGLRTSFGSRPSDFGFVRPARLAGLTLTNKPNNKGGKPITNREEPQMAQMAQIKTASSVQSVSSVASNPVTQNKRTKPMQTIATKLGLAAEASEDAILAEVTKIMNRANEATTELDTAKKTVTTLEGQLTAFKETQADSDLEAVKNKLKPEQLTALRTQLINNRETTLPLLEIVRMSANSEAAASNPDITCSKCGHKFAGAKNRDGQIRNPKSEIRSPVTNRDTAQTPADRRGVLPGDQAIRVAVDEYRVRNRCSFQQAWEAVKHEKPDLFKTENQ